MSTVATNQMNYFVNLNLSALVLDTYFGSLRPAERLHCDIQPFYQHPSATFILSRKHCINLLQFHLQIKTNKQTKNRVQS